MERKCLNLGCGAFKKPGFVNVDIDPKVHPNALVDLSKFPYPFGDEEFDHIESDHNIEHLDDAFGVMREIHRILKQNGTVVLRMPHFSRGFTHPDHRRGFDVSFPYYFQKSFPGGFSGIEFEHVSSRLVWNAQPYLKKEVLSPGLHYGLLAIGKVIDILANLSPAFCSRVWCFWVGGFEEIEFRFRKRA